LAGFPVHLASKYLKALPAVSLTLDTKQEERSMDDRRKETRRRFSAFTPVYDLYPRTLLGYLGDLNMQGALVIGKNLTTINKETILEIIFPGELADITVVPVTIPARIAWCRADEPSQSYSIGVEFTELTPLYKELIQQILERYHFSHSLSDADFDQER
jgi:PilZ domain